MSRQERVEKKEQKLRLKLRKQGLSDKETEKRIQANRKRKKIAGIVIGVILGVLVAIAIVCVSVPQIRNYLANIADIGNQESEEEKLVKFVDNLIPQEKSDLNKKSLDEFIGNQEKSKDIIIPDDATEEQKQVLEEKKTYLEIVEKINRMYRRKFSPVSDGYADNVASTMTGIINIFKMEGGYAFYVSAINKLGDKYFKSNTVLKVVMAEEFSTFEELNDNLQKSDSATVLFVFNEYSRCEDINNELFRLLSNRYPSHMTLEPIDMNTDLQIDSEFPPMYSTLFVKVKSPESEWYVLGTVSYATESLSSNTYEELLEKLRSQTGATAFQDCINLKNIDLDWVAYKTQNQ